MAGVSDIPLRCNRAEMEGGKKRQRQEKKGNGGAGQKLSVRGLSCRDILKEKIQTAGRETKCPNIQCGASRVSEDGEWIDPARLLSGCGCRSRYFALDHVTALLPGAGSGGWIGAGKAGISQRKKRFRNRMEKWVYVGRGQYALPSLAFVPLYIESDHRGCVCRCNFRGVLRKQAGDAVYKALQILWKDGVGGRSGVYSFRPGEGFTMESRDCFVIGILCADGAAIRGGIYGCVFILWKWIGADGGKESRRGERAE